MSSVFSSFVEGAIIGLVVVAVAAMFYYMTKNYGYWKKKRVPYIKPQFPFGTLTPQVLLQEDVGTTVMKIYSEYKRCQGLKYVGAFTFLQPNLIVFDLDLSKHILTKDFAHFSSRDLIPPTTEYLTKHLFSLEGREWKDMRTKLTPTFTSGKMKLMFALIEACAGQLVEHIEERVLVQERGEFQVKPLLARFTTDVIATCAFGLEINSIKDEDNEFFKIGQEIFVPKLMDYVKYFYHRNFPTLANIYRIRVLHPRIEPLLSKVIGDNVKHRKDNDISRNDFIDLLLKVKENRSLDDHESDSVIMKNRHDSKKVGPDSLTMEQMTAQAFVFFAAGFETAASTTSFCLYELAKSPSVQQRLRREIGQVLSRHGGELTYQALQDMPYMDQVINETLRMYASLPVLTRVCTESYLVPGTKLIIDEGVRVSIPIYAIHHDPDIYPDPYKFDPDRFSEENSKNRHHYAFIPFGEGPRICIGMRFGRLQVKAGLVAILSRYWLSPGPLTPDKLELDPRILFTTCKVPFSLRICRHTDIKN